MLLAYSYEHKGGGGQYTCLRLYIDLMLYYKKFLSQKDNTEWRVPSPLAPRENENYP